jgi:carbonic anhydrase
MDRRQIMKAMAGLALCPLCAKRGGAADAHWSYEGHNGPEGWAALDPANAVCSAGSQQSPIDIGETVRSELPALKIAWAQSADTIVNNGHTIQVNFAEGSTLTTAVGNYRLVQFHFHRPSEHLIGGKSFPMEVHFVHANPQAGLAVLGALMTTGGSNAVFNKVVATMPQAEGPAVKADPGIDPNGLLPAGRGYYRYEGSLTTPPCSETVDWHLLTDPIQVAQADVERFAKLYPMNARPAQKVARRFVLRSS